jgi:hypothetical protein
VTSQSDVAAPCVTPGTGKNEASARLRNRYTLLAVGGGTVLLLLVGAILVRYADGRVNRTSMGDAPRPVTVIEARGSTYRDSRSYVGAVESWIEAEVGPQYISAYVETVVVRPGDSVVAGQIRSLHSWEC